MEYVVLAIMALGGVGAVWWIVSKYRTMGGSGQRKFFQLPPDDGVRYMWRGEFDSNMSGKERLVREVATGVVNWLGADTDFRPRALSLALSRQGRMSFVLEMPDHTARVFVHEPGEVRLRPFGPGVRTIQGGPSLRFTVRSNKLEGLPILLHESAQQHLAHCITDN